MRGHIAASRQWLGIGRCQGEQQPILAIPRWLRHSGNLRPPGQRRGQADRRSPIASMVQETEGRTVPPAGLNWWATLRDALPDSDVLAAAVAEELGEPLEDVRPSVMTATLVRRVDASLDDLRAVVDGERERARVRDVSTTRRGGERRVRAETLEDLLAETRRLADAGTLDLPAAVAVQRAAGGIAARSGTAPGAVPRPARRHPPPRLGPLRRRAAGRPAGCRSPGRDGPLDLPVDRDHLARGHGRLPGRRARDPRP